jgi:hypothetical protein
LKTRVTKILIGLSLVLVGTTFRVQGQQPISVELKKNCEPTSAIWVDGVRIAQRDVYRALSQKLRASEKGDYTPVIVLMSTQCGFDDWLDIRTLLYGKIGFRDVRYFIVSEETEHMSEVELHPAMPISTNPPKSESR